MFLLFFLPYLGSKRIVFGYGFKYCISMRVAFVYIWTRPDAIRYILNIDSVVKIEM